MAKKIKYLGEINTRPLDLPGDVDSPGESTIADTPNDTPDPAPQPHELRYVGPAYDKGIQLHRTRTLIRPGEFTQEEAREFIAAHPQHQDWWQLQ